MRSLCRTSSRGTGQFSIGGIFYEPAKLSACGSAPSRNRRVVDAVIYSLLLTALGFLTQDSLSYHVFLGPIPMRVIGGHHLRRRAQRVLDLLVRLSCCVAEKVDTVLMNVDCWLEKSLCGVHLDDRWVRGLTMVRV